MQPGGKPDGAVEHMTFHYLGVRAWVPLGQYCLFCRAVAGSRTRGGRPLSQDLPPEILLTGDVTDSSWDFLQSTHIFDQSAERHGLLDIGITTLSQKRSILSLSGVISQLWVWLHRKVSIFPVPW